jgi:hypothetical protein
MKKEKNKLGTVIHAQKERPVIREDYTKVPNSLFFDENISVHARITLLFIYASAKANDYFDLDKNEIMYYCKYSEWIYKKVIKELLNANYLYKKELAKTKYKFYFSITKNAKQYFEIDETRKDSRIKKEIVKLNDK